MTPSLTSRFSKLAIAAAVASCAGLWAGSVPASAFSITYCVQKPACAGTDKTDLQEALNAAKAAPGPDRIELGQGTFSSAGGYAYSDAGTNTVEIVGEGAGVTRLVNTMSGTGSTLVLLNGTVSDLEVVGPAGEPNADFTTALWLQGAAERVKVTGGFLGVRLEDDSQLRDSVVVGSGLDNERPAVLFAGDSGQVLDSTVTAVSIGIHAPNPGHFKVSRSTVSGGAAVTATGGAFLDIDNSLVRASAEGLEAQGEPSQSSRVVAVNVTIVGSGATSTGVRAVSHAPGQYASVVVQNSVISGVQHTLKRTATVGTAYITLKNSDYDFSTATQSGPGNVKDQGGNTSAAPGFVNTAGGDFRLAPGSPLIDAGTGSPQGGLAARDRDGASRSVDGNGDGTAVPDIGAYEFVQATPADPPVGGSPEPQPDAPVPTGPDRPAAPVLPKLSAVSFSPRRFRTAQVGAQRAARKRGRGSKLRFTLSQNARVRVALKSVPRGHRARKAGSLQIAGQAGANSRKFTGRIGTRALKPGRYVAALTAVDAAGRKSSTRRVGFIIVGR
jgi:hypothetical protein